VDPVAAPSTSSVDKNRVGVAWGCNRFFKSFKNIFVSKCLAHTLVCSSNISGLYGTIPVFWNALMAVEGSAAFRYRLHKKFRPLADVSVLCQGEP
jgi:hypothetical protein